MMSNSSDSSEHSLALQGTEPEAELHAEIDDRFQQYPEPMNFLSEVLPLLCDASDSVAAILWVQLDDSKIRWQASHGVELNEATQANEYTTKVLENVTNVFSSAEAITCDPDHNTELPDSSQASTLYNLVTKNRQRLIPIRCQNRVLAVIVLFQPTTSPDQIWTDEPLGSVQTRLEGWVSIGIDAVTSQVLASNIPPGSDESMAPAGGSDLAAMQSQLEQQQRVCRLTEVVGRDLDDGKVAVHVANETYSFLGEGRISVAYFQGTSCQIKAISNQQVFDRRAATIVALEKLAARTALVRQALWHPESEDRLPKNDRKLLEEYYEASDAQSVALIPLIQSEEPSEDPEDLAAVIRDQDATEGKVIGVLIVEGIDRTLGQAEIAPQLEQIQKPIINAIANARSHSSLFLMPVWKELGRFTGLFRGHHRNKAIGASLLAIIAALVLTLVPADLRLRCEGVIQPTSRSKVYAQAEGTVTKLLVKDGEWVKKGQPLVTLSNPEVLAQLAEVEGELQELNESIRTCKLQRMRNDFTTEQERNENVQKCASYVASLSMKQARYDLLLEKKAQLTINSPVFGQVITWDLPRRLSGRPVKPGQKLMTIANSKGPWELELKLADKRVGHLQRRLQEAPSDKQKDSLPKTTFILASHPTKVYDGRLRAIANTADVDETDGNVVRVYVDLDQHPTKSEIHARPGTEVIAHIHAGRGSLGYCKLYEFFDWIRRTAFRYV